MNKIELNIKKIRMQKMWSQMDLAKKTGLEPSAISHFENGRRVPSLQNFVKIKKALNCSYDDLLNVE